ncbi:MAG: 2-polyprenylphenol 6-hydroxylase [Legionellales bacterium]|nr:2-polyprenylphenol 6-hydroxylase [Legionellales bacterium]
MSIIRLYTIIKLARVYQIADCFKLHEPLTSQTADRGRRLREFLTELGPIFIKLGQILSIRGDIFPDDVIAELEKLQDQVPPFSGEVAEKTVIEAFRQPLDHVFQSFDTIPIASASVAQVHSAVLKTGQRVAVKIIRPNIRSALKQEISWMKSIARFGNWFHPDSKRLHFSSIIREFETSIYNEIDLNYEAANAGQFRRQFKHSDQLYIPEIYWDLVTRDVMVMEFIEGTNLYNTQELKEKQVSLPQLAQIGVQLFFKQVLEHSFFHADLHPGNLFVDTTLVDNPKFIAIDFGIVGILTPMDRHYIASNFIAFFNQDYRRIAELHVESGWVPNNTRIDEFESSIRTICEPLFSRPLRDISLAKLMLSLFQVARRFETEIQPQLLMLQKTLFTVEALGRNLDPDLNLWDTAKPEIERWAESNSRWTTWLNHLLQSPPTWLDKPSSTDQPVTQDKLTLELPPAIFTLTSLVIILTLTDISPTLIVAIHILVLLTQLKK